MPMAASGDDDLHHLLLLLHLPEDVIAEILIYLPVPSLLRLKSVCRSWRSLIERSDFVHRHATFDGNHPSSSNLGAFIFEARRGNRFSLVYKPHFYVRYGEEFEVVEDLGVPPFFSDEEEEEKVGSCPGEDPTVGSSPGEELETESEEEEEEEVVVEDPFVPPILNDSDSEEEPPRPREVHMVSSCHGIVCLHDNVYKDVALWNPATKEFRFLPKSLEFHGLGSYVEAFVALGYDLKTKDYKVLMVTSYMPPEPAGIRNWIRRVQVYSLSSDSWRCIDVDLHIECVTVLALNQGRYLNGHFILLGRIWFIEQGNVGSINVILKFDFGKEIFTSIELPDESTPTQLDLIGDKIVCFIYKRAWNFEAWVLNDNCTNKPWTQLYTFGPYPNLYDVPKAVTKNGEFCFINFSAGMLLCNLATQEMKDCPFDSSTFVQVYKADVFKWSLVSISGQGSAAAERG